MISSTPNGRLAVIGDSEFATDNFVQKNSNNLILFQNIIDSMTLDQDLVNIRSKGITDRPLKALTELQKKYIKYFNIFGITFMAIIFGIVKYNLRKRKKISDEI